MRYIPSFDLHWVVLPIIYESINQSVAQLSCEHISLIYKIDVCVDSWGNVNHPQHPMQNVNIYFTNSVEKRMNLNHAAPHQYYEMDAL